MTAGQAEAMYEAGAALKGRDLYSWAWTRDGETVDVTVALTQWEQITVLIWPRGSGTKLSGVFAEDGRLIRLQFEARPGERVHAADLRRFPAVSALKEWETVGREIGRQITAGVPDEELAYDATSPAAALASLSRAARRKPGGRVRAAAAHEALLRRVADAYKAAAGDRAPRKTVAVQLGYSASHISRLLAEARRAGVIT
jgi:hypothetical protein